MLLHMAPHDGGVHGGAECAAVREGHEADARGGLRALRAPHGARAPALVQHASVDLSARYPPVFGAVEEAESFGKLLTPLDYVLGY